MVSILQIHFFGGFVYSCNHTSLFVCLGLSAFSFIVGVLEGEQWTRRRCAPLEISRRATLDPLTNGSFVRVHNLWVCHPTKWGRFVCESVRTMAI